VILRESVRSQHRKELADNAIVDCIFLAGMKDFVQSLVILINDAHHSICLYVVHLLHVGFAKALWYY
jgi:hypothetical protein